MWPICREKADVGAGKAPEKNFEKKLKKVLTKWLWGGKIAKRLSAGQLSGVGKSRRKT